jgi:3-phenylpropionate/trans-cinnamate dioxygenase ferredoxin subunit
MTTHDPRDKRFVVAKAADIHDGGRLIVTVLGKQVGIFNVRGTFYAILNRCPHKGAELCKGDVVGLIESDRPGDIRLDSSRVFIACPWHGWEYDLANGQSWFNPLKTRARPYPVSVETGSCISDELRDGLTTYSPEVNGNFVDPKTHRVAGPYVADIVPVSVEDAYIVISLRDRSAGSTGERSAEHGD